MCLANMLPCCLFAASLLLARLCFQRCVSQLIINLYSKRKDNTKYEAVFEARVTCSLFSTNILQILSQYQFLRKLWITEAALS